jgi:hypothetical protein
MARLLFPSSAESVTCMRCGNAVLGDAETCPHCGADHGGSRTGATTAALASGLRLPFAARRGSLAAPSPYPSVPEEAEFAGTGEQRWDNSKSVTLGAVMLALIAGGVIYSQSGERESAIPETPAGHSAYGAIDMKAAYGASAPAIQSAAATPAKPAVQAPGVVTPNVFDTTARAATSAAIIDNLQAARDAIDRGDLTTARRRFSKIPAAQMNVGNIQRTQSELVSLERARDNLLQMARGCEATGSWMCVRQNARDVLAIDASNVEAQTLVEHAITRSGWLNKTPPVTASVAPKPNGTAPLATATVPVRRAVSVPAAQPRSIAVMPAPTQSAPVASDSTRVSTGSHAPLTSSGSIAAPQTATWTSTFIPMPDGPETPVARSATPAPVAARSPSAEASAAHDQTRSVTEAVAVRAAAIQPSAIAVPATPAVTNPAPVAVARTVVSGDGAQNAAQPKTIVRSTPDTDAEERAILESGWTKASPKQRSLSQ